MLEVFEKWCTKVLTRTIIYSDNSHLSFFFSLWYGKGKNIQLNSSVFDYIFIRQTIWLFLKGFGSNVKFFAANDESEGALSPPFIWI